MLLKTAECVTMFFSGLHTLNRGYVYDYVYLCVCVCDVQCVSCMEFLQKSYLIIDTYCCVINTETLDLIFCSDYFGVPLWLN